MSGHAFVSDPEQVRHLRRTYPGISNRGLWGLGAGWDVVVALWQAEGGYDATYLGHEHHTLSFVLSGAETERMDGPFAGRRARPDRETVMLYADGGARRYVARGRIELCQLYFQRSFVATLAAAEGGSAGTVLREDRVIAQDRELRQLAGTLLARARKFASALEMDAHAVLFGLHLLRCHSSRAPRRPAERGLDRCRLDVVIELVESRLDGDIRLAQMAAAVGLSPSHFCTAFRLATGSSPHAFVTGRRIERAKERLAGGEPIVQVALACGFSSQQHLTTQFRRSTGATPAVWRAAHAARGDDEAAPQDPAPPS